MTTPLSDAFLARLHTRPLLQCVCGQVLEDSRCARLFCQGNHAPERRVDHCRVCTPGHAPRCTRTAPHHGNERTDDA
jgi:hypothetical protein